MSLEINTNFRGVCDYIDAAVKASLREGGGPHQRWKELRDFRFVSTFLLRTLPQSPSVTAPSRREP